MKKGLVKFETGAGRKGYPMKSNMWDDINKVYTAQLIMTPMRSLSCWETGSTKDDYIDHDGRLKYDVIPVGDKGKIIGFMTKEKPFDIQMIENGWIITQDTPISDLVHLFEENKKPAYFVYYRDEIVGILTPADLNKLPARIYIYSLLGDVELMLSEIIRNEPGISQRDILNSIGAGRSEEIIKDMNKLQDQNVDIDVVQLLYLSDMLSVVQKSSILRKRLSFSSRSNAEKGLSGINDLRNKTMHLVKPVLVKMPDDLVSLRIRLKRIESILTLGQNGNLQD